METGGTVDRYVSYVEEQIKKMVVGLEVIDFQTNEITPNKINTALANFTPINLMLNAEYQRLRKEEQDVKKDFRKWSDIKFVETKDRMMKNVSKSVKLSKVEIDIQVRYDSTEEYDEFENHLQELEMKVDYVERLLDQWKDHAWVLRALSDNMRTELRTLNIERSMDSFDPLAPITNKEENRRRKIVT